MRAVVQRVTEANVLVEGKILGEIQRGLLVFLGVEENDESTDVEYMLEKVMNLRIFEDAEGKMNRSLLDVQEDLMVVSQFTLLGDCRKGRRPSFINAARPEKANELYKIFVEKAKNYGIKVQTGVFQAEMKVSLCNDGPVTIIIDSKRAF
ncbi:MAG: D-tyrosyl-tRNA(Tyr) deacylase [Alkaliphilus sp.]|nr:D-tyrosyl-tRNA(Tyr) deacylase [Alkaliphilus sp.]